MTKQFSRISGAPWTPVTAEEHATARDRLKVLLRRYEREEYRDDSPELAERLKDRG